MIKTKAFTLLQSLSASQLKKFGRFLQSPYFVDNDDLLRLFKIYHRQLKSNGSATKGLEKKAIWKKLFGNQTYRDVAMRRLNSDLCQQAEHFLSIEQFSRYPLPVYSSLLNAVNDVSLHKHFTGVLRKIREQHKKPRRQSPARHFYLYQTEYTCHTHLEKTGSRRKDFENLERADFFLDSFYYLQKLKLYASSLSYDETVARPPEVNLPDQFIERLQDSTYLDDPVIYAYFLVVKMLHAPEEDHYFQQLKKHLLKMGAQFSRPELHELYILLKNFCIDKKINTGHTRYFNELFEIYKIQFEQDIIFERGILPPQTYKNIITVGLVSKEFDWVEDFIQQYTNRLPKENQENALNYNLAKVYFHQEAYPKVIEQLREVEYKSLVYALGGKLMLLKTYYELSEFDALDSLIDSFRVYLRRNREISKDLRQQYLNILRFVKKLSMLPPGDQASLEKVRLQIEKCKALPDKNWILEKVGELQR